jgi:hypothetical protein
MTFSEKKLRKDISRPAYLAQTTLLGVPIMSVAILTSMCLAWLTTRNRTVEDKHTNLWQLIILTRQQTCLKQPIIDIGT